MGISSSPLKRPEAEGAAAPTARPRLWLGLWLMLIPMLILMLMTLDEIRRLCLDGVGRLLTTLEDFGQLWTSLDVFRRLLIFG